VSTIIPDTNHAFDGDAVQTDGDVAVDALFRMGSAFDGYTAQMRRAFGINAHERLALSALWERGPMTMTDLGAWIPLSRAAVTTLVDRLEAADLVVRGADATDRRRTVVSIRDVALERMTPVILPWSESVKTLVRDRPRSEWRVIAAFIDDLRTLHLHHAEQLGLMSDATIQALAAPRDS